MKVHSYIEQDAPDLVPLIKQRARQVGLDKIDYEQMYRLIKLGAKNKSSRGYPDKFEAGRGLVRLIGNGEDVAVYLAGLTEWFRTSPVLRCVRLKDGYKFETENSHYKLERL